MNMYTAKRREVRKIRVEFEIETPCTAKDIYDTIHTINSELENRKKGKSEWDDAWHAEPHDEHITFYYEYDEKVK